jgi:hypothetical protein
MELCNLGVRGGWTL